VGGDVVDTELSKTLALAWGSAQAPKRGPKREFSLERVLAVAIDIADADGLDAVTMPAVASALGLTAMSIYRYVSSKDGLVLLMQERALGTPPEPLAATEGWRAALEAHAAASEDMYRRHPWLLDIPIRGVTVTPNNLAWLEAGLLALAHTSLTPRERIAVVLEVTGHARFRALVERGYDQRAGEAEGGLEGFVLAEAGLLSQLVSDDRFPQLHGALAAGALVDPFDKFDFGLARILDGVESYLAHTA
jgi:AcrR family transcriptional regulator